MPHPDWRQQFVVNPKKRKPVLSGLTVPRVIVKTEIRFERVAWG